jgi:hypothetical protein
MVQARTRPCPHCKATILDSASICPGCHHHLRFGSDTLGQAAQEPARTAWQVEGTLAAPADEKASEYSVVIVVRNERDEVVARQVVNVGALAGNERRTFTLSVEMAPLRRPARRL